MANLYTFGDSFTDYFKPPENQNRHWRHEYIEYKGYVPKVYGEIIAEKLNLNLINKGVGGIGNHQIFENFCILLEKINSEDIIIFGWSNQERIRLVKKNKQWGHFAVNFSIKDSAKKEGDSHFWSIDSLNSFESLSERTLKEIMYNRTNNLYTIELSNWIKLINFSLPNNKILHWSWDERIKDCGGIFISKLKTIYKESNGLINDFHWCEDSHYEVSKLFISLIKTNDTKNQKKFL